MPSAWSSSSRASSVTVWSVFQFEVVKVRGVLLFTLRSWSWVPVVLRATLTVTLAEGFVVSFTL